MGRQLTTQDFIVRARKVHGNKYDYSKTIYVKSILKVLIGCPAHGDFEQTPNHHINNFSGCPECENESKKNRYTKTLEQFINEARAVHGNKYDYGKVIYKNSRIKILIGCPAHGDFEQTPDEHLSSKFGCKKCADIERGLALRTLLIDFIKSARSVHGLKYDYDKVIWHTWDNKICITCYFHGDFWMLPGNHINGKQGCKKCHLESIIDPNPKAPREQKKGLDWKKAVYKKDYYTCQKCGDKKGCKLHAHHIYNWHDYPDLRFNIENGITLCQTCHKRFHSLYGNRFNNQDQLNDFLTEDIFQARIREIGKNSTIPLFEI